ncbi:MAG TPA: HIT family protein, partial [Acidimicrobiales bacterium]
QIVLDDDLVLAFLDIRPLFPGHLLLVPKEHHETLTDLPADQVTPYFAAVQRLAGAVEAAMGAQGTFVAINNRVSQSVPHLHTHVVPRTKGDGLKGFFWPRTRYRDDAHMAEVGALIRAVLASAEDPA